MEIEKDRVVRGYTDIDRVMSSKIRLMERIKR